jgi:hypothetical protein
VKRRTLDEVRVEVFPHCVIVLASLALLVLAPYYLGWVGTVASAILRLWSLHDKEGSTQQREGTHS